MGYVVPNFYTSIEPKKDDEESLASTDLLDLPRYKKDLNQLLGEEKSVAYILIDKLDEFVSGENYATQIDTLQSLMHCWRDYQSYPKLKLKFFLRKDLYGRLDFSSIGRDKIDPRKVELKWTDEDIRQLMAARIFHNIVPLIKGRKIKFECDKESLNINQEFLSEIRTLDAALEHHQSWAKRAKRCFILLRARLNMRKRDDYDARTVNMHDIVNRAILTLLFPRAVNHSSNSKKIEQIELSKYLSSHFQFSNDSTTPRIILLYMQKCLEIAKDYYRHNPEEDIPQNDKGEYPVFLRDHLSTAYKDLRHLALQTIIGLNHEWSRSATVLMQLISKSKTPHLILFKDAKKMIGKSMDQKDLSDFFAFYEHAGLFSCLNRTSEVETRIYSIPVFFQGIELSNT